MPRSGRRVVVSDAGPLIALGRLDLLHVLADLFLQVQVPEAVIKECMARPQNVDALRIRFALDQQWLTQCEVTAVAVPGLALGECAAIARALEIGAALVVDDRAARQHASVLGVSVIGTLGILVLAKRAGHVGAIGPLVAALRASGQRLSKTAVSQALAAVSE